MKISYNWLQLYFNKKLPKPERIAELLTMHSLEVGSIHEVRLRSTTKTDFVFNIDILPNRAHDCLAHYGVAKEIAAIMGISNFQIPISKQIPKAKISKKLEIEVKEPELCRRYVGRIIEGVKVGPSPKWIKERLEAIGQKSINNIVDATNFVMFELGQPLHAFDADKVGYYEDGLRSTTKSVFVRKAKKGEIITTLDNQNIDLDENILIIADDKGPLAIAGIKGGKKAEITKETKNIILEAANFEPVNIKKTSKRINLSTDSSLRFENEITPELAELAIERVTDIIKEFSKVKISSTIDFYPRQACVYEIGIRPREISKILGIHISEKEIVDLLKRLGFAVKKINPVKNVLKLAKSLKGASYKYGASVTFDAPKYFDCSSFVSYVFAHSGVQIPRMTVDQYFFGMPVDMKNIQPGDVVFSCSSNGKIHYKSKEFMRGLKIKEGIDHCGIYLGKGKVVHATRKKGKIIIEDLKKSKSFKRLRDVKRMITEDNDLLLVAVPPERLDLRIKEDLVEEVARIYGYEKIPSEIPHEILVPPKRNDSWFYADVVRNILIGAGFSEVYNYSFSEKGNVLILNPIAKDKTYLRINLLDGLRKSIDDNLRYFKSAELFEIGRIFPPGGETISLAATASDIGFYEIKGVVEMMLDKLSITDYYFEDLPDKTADIRIGNTSIGFIGHNGFEINFEMLVRMVEEETEYRPISRYPAVKRDLAIFVPLKTRMTEVLDVVENTGGELLVDTDLFDIYEFEDEDRKSFAFHLVFQSSKKTLSDKEVNDLMKKIMDTLEATSPSWEIRR